MKYNLLMLMVFFFCLSSSVKASDKTAVVELKQFEVGHFWLWHYYRLNSELNTWEHYSSEHYQVTSKEGDLITIEMSSAPAGSEIKKPHHKFVVDFRKCLRAARNPIYRSFTVKLYTRSLGDQWTVIPNSKGYAFQEKFNCLNKIRNYDLLYKDIDFEGSLYKAFRSRHRSSSKPYGSWYFLDHEKLRGIVVEKLFRPAGEYKFKLVDYGKKEL